MAKLLEADRSLGEIRMIPTMTAMTLTTANTVLTMMTSKVSLREEVMILRGRR